MPTIRVTASATTTSPRPYFALPLQCTHAQCHAAVAPRLRQEAAIRRQEALTAFQKEQWELAAPKPRTYASQYHPVIREPRWTWMALIGWFITLVTFGLAASPVRVQTIEQATPAKGLAEVLWIGITTVLQGAVDLITAVGKLTYRTVKLVDWNKLWQVLAFAYVVHVWVKRREEAHAHERNMQMATPKQMEVGGVRYRLVEGTQSWSRSVWELPHI